MRITSQPSSRLVQRTGPCAMVINTTQSIESTSRTDIIIRCRTSNIYHHEDNPHLTRIVCFVLLLNTLILGMLGFGKKNHLSLTSPMVNQTNFGLRGFRFCLCHKREPMDQVSWRLAPETFRMPVAGHIRYCFLPNIAHSVSLSTKSNLLELS